MTVLIVDDIDETSNFLLESADFVAEKQVSRDEFEEDYLGPVYKVHKDSLASRFGRLDDLEGEPISETKLVDAARRRENDKAAHIA